MKSFQPKMLLLPACLCLALSSAAQDNLQTTSAAVDHPPVFEVVSIRPSTSSVQGGHVRSDGDRFESIGLPLGYLILWAYFPMALQRQNSIAGAPPWIWNDKFDFVGKVASEDVAQWQNAGRQGFGQSNAMLETMLQVALAERCRLIVRRVPATMLGFALVVANHGPRWKRFSLAKPDEVIPDNAQPMPKGGRMVPIN